MKETETREGRQIQRFRARQNVGYEELQDFETREVAAQGLWKPSDGIRVGRCVETTMSEDLGWARERRKDTRRQDTTFDIQGIEIGVGKGGWWQIFPGREIEIRQAEASDGRVKEEWKIVLGQDMGLPSIVFDREGHCLE